MPKKENKYPSKPIKTDIPIKLLLKKSSALFPFLMTLLSYRKKLFEKFIELKRSEKMPIEIPQKLIQENPLFQIGRKEGELKLLKKTLKEKFPELYKKKQFKNIDKLPLKSIEKVFLVALRSDDPQKVLSAIQKELKKAQP